MCGHLPVLWGRLIESYEPEVIKWEYPFNNVFLVMSCIDIIKFYVVDTWL